MLLPGVRPSLVGIRMNCHDCWLPLVTCTPELAAETLRSVPQHLRSFTNKQTGFDSIGYAPHGANQLPSSYGPPSQSGTSYTKPWGRIRCGVTNHQYSVFCVDLPASPPSFPNLTTILLTLARAVTNGAPSLPPRAAPASLDCSQQDSTVCAAELQQCQTLGSPACRGSDDPLCLFGIVPDHVMCAGGQCVGGDCEGEFDSA